MILALTYPEKNPRILDIALFLIFPSQSGVWVFKGSNTLDQIELRCLIFGSEIAEIVGYWEKNYF